MATAVASSKVITSFKIKNISNFVSFLKRFSSIEKNLLLEITPDALVAKSYTPDKAVVKFSKMPLVDVLEGTCPAPLVKVAIYDVTKVINLFNYFQKTDEIRMDMRTDTIAGEVVGLDLTFKSDALKIKIECADLTLFTYIAPEMIARIVKGAVDDKLLEFSFPKEAFGKISSLCGIDGMKDYLNIKVSGGKVLFSSKSFEYAVCDAAGDVEFALFNEYFGMIEADISQMIIGQKKLLVKSQESQTMIIIGRID